MPTRRRRARGAVAPGDTFGFHTGSERSTIWSRFVVRARRPCSVAATGGERVGCARRGGHPVCDRYQSIKQLASLPRPTKMFDNWSGMTLHIAILVCAAVPLLAAAVTAELTVVPSVDLKSYVGKWYEIARLPNRFQKSCASDVSATYSLRPDGKITVSNQCVTAKGEIKSATGIARLAGKSQPNTKLKVTFFWPFSGNYWIIDLDSEYPCLRPLEQRRTSGGRAGNSTFRNSWR